VTIWSAATTKCFPPSQTAAMQIVMLSCPVQSISGKAKIVAAPQSCVNWNASAGSRTWPIKRGTLPGNHRLHVAFPSVISDIFN
jgi:hypothetical protein